MDRGGELHLTKIREFGKIGIRGPAGYVFWRFLYLLMQMVFSGSDIQRIKKNSVIF